MKTLPCSMGLIRLLSRCTAHTESAARELEMSKEFQMEDAVGECIRAAAEQARQDVAVLNDIVKRYTDV